MNSIDTVYEAAGAELSGRLHDVLWSMGLPLILALAGVAVVVHALASERATFRDLATYFLALALFAWLLVPVGAEPVRIPRYVFWLNRAADAVQTRTIRAVNERFLDSPFEQERIAALASFGRIFEPALSDDVARFLKRCARPALVRNTPRIPNLLRPGSLEYSELCEKERSRLWNRLREHLKTHPVHRALLEAVRKRSPSESAAFRDGYLDRLAVRAQEEPGSPTNEAELVLESLGSYSYTDPSQSVGHAPTWAKILIGPMWLPMERREEAYNLTLTGLAELTQDWENRWTAKQQRFMVTIFGPHLYGLSLLLLIGLFPIAGLFALLPRKWKVLVTYAEVFFSVKLWPVCWAILTTFNERRSVLDALKPADRSDGNVFLAVSAFYLLTPVVAFLIVHLATASPPARS